MEQNVIYSIEIYILIIRLLKIENIKLMRIFTNYL